MSPALSKKVCFAFKPVKPKINQVSFWTDNLQKTWNGYRLLCRACLKDWRQNYPEDYQKLVSQAKKVRFRSYLYNGLFDKNDLVNIIKNKNQETK